MDAMTRSDHDSAFGTWQTVHRPASPALRAWVHGYFASSSRLRVPVRERHLPSLEVPLVLNFGAPHHRLESNGSDESTTRDGCWVVGLHRTPQRATAIGERHFLVVRLTPIGAHRVLGLPMHLLANAAVDVDQINPALARTLSDRVRTARTWSDRVRAAEAVIADRLASAVRRDRIEPAWHALTAANGRLALGPLATDVGCSHRVLIERFQTCVGLPPRTISRLLRFNRVVRSLDRISRARAGAPASTPFIETADPAHRLTESVRWAELAADCGYADQSHFIKEFTAFAGMTPRAFVRQVSYQV